MHFHEFKTHLSCRIGRQAFSGLPGSRGVASRFGWQGSFVQNSVWTSLFNTCWIGGSWLGLSLCLSSSAFFSQHHVAADDCFLSRQRNFSSTSAPDLARCILLYIPPLSTCASASTRSSRRSASRPGLQRGSTCFTLPTTTQPRMSPVDGSRRCMAE